jgi:pimeloyl-ACP methyl ester carboxylesterase
MRFASNGYPASRVRVHEYDSYFTINTEEEVFDGLDVLVDELLTETGETQIDLLGHSLGTTLMLAYLTSSTERAAKVAHYVNIDGRSATEPPGGVDTLAIWGMGDPNRAIVGAENLYFPEQAHVQVATSAESFAAQYEFFTGAPPATTDILPEPQVQLSGRAVNFPYNTGVDGTLEIYRVDAATGGRIDPTPDATFVLSAAEAGVFGPFDAVGGQHHELLLLRDGARPQHFYPQPVVRSDHLLRLLTSDPTSPISTQADPSPNTSNLVISRYREFWGDQGADNDVFEIDGLNIISPTNSPMSKRVNGIFVFDDDLDGVNDLVDTHSFYFLLPFITAMDVFIPGANPPNDVIEIRSTSRDGQSVAINMPNWASSDHVISVILQPFTQASAALDKQDQKCVNSINKGAAKIAKAHAGDNSACIKDGSKGKLTGTIEECITSDPKGKVQKAIGKIKVGDCPSPPPWPPIDIDPNSIGDKMIAKELDLIHAIFGSDLDMVVVDMATQKDDAKCQQAIAKAVQKCQDTKLKEFNACKKNKLKGKGTPKAASPGELQAECLGTGVNGIPDGKGKINKACVTKINGAISKKCGTSDTDTLFPGCAGEPLQPCLDQKVECEVCKALNALDGLIRDCDEFDDGVVNDSCP